jgi:hypothetical protein
MSSKLTSLMLCLCVGALGTPWPQNTPDTIGVGIVEGKVLDWTTGRPVPEARVTAEPDDVESGRSGKVRSAVTDDAGSFLLDLAPGSYVIAASKEQDYYPDTDTAAFASHLEALPKVSIHEGQVIRNIAVRLEKGARLIGTISDEQTNQPIVGSRIRLSRADNPKLWIETGPDTHGYFKFVIPSLPFRVEVFAPGYQNWTFKGQISGAPGVLQVKPETTFELPVVLKR